MRLYWRMPTIVSGMVIFAASMKKNVNCLHTEIASISRKIYEDWEVGQLLHSTDSFIEWLAKVPAFFSDETSLIKKTIISRGNPGSYSLRGTEIEPWA